MVRRNQRAQSKTSRRGGAARPGAVGRARDSKRTPAALTGGLRAVAKFLDASLFPAAVIGGIAVIAHGYARSTVDVDVAIAAGESEGWANRVLTAAEQAGLTIRIPDAVAFAEANLVLLLEHRATGTPVDVSLALQDFEQRALREAKPRPIGPVKLRTAPLESLLVYKMIASRPRDLDDVRALLTTSARIDAKRIRADLEAIDALLETTRAAEFDVLLRASGRRADV